MRYARVCNTRVGGDVVHTWTKRAGERPTMESAAGGVSSFEHSALRGGYSAVEVGILRRGL